MRRQIPFLSFDELWQNLCLAARLIRKQPVFTLAVIASLGLGIGVNTGVFTLLNALAFRPLPVENPEQLVRIGSLENNGTTISIPDPVLRDLRNERSIQGVCGFTAGDALVEFGDNSLPLATHSLTGDCYRTLGVRPALGRLLTLADDNPNGPNVAILGYAFWKERFGGDPHVLGRTIRISGKAFQIIGVTESRFQGLLWGYPPSVSAPISQRIVPNQKDPSARFYWADTLARLRPGTKPRDFETHLKVRWRLLLDAALPPTFTGASRKELIHMPPVVTPAAAGVDYYYRERFQPPLTVLAIVSGLMLLLACFNVANLLFARGWKRRREVAIRVALGAARIRIVRQLVVESALLIALGFGAAVGLSQIIVRFVVSTFEQAYGRTDLLFDAHVDARVLLLIALTATVVVALAAVLPALGTSDLRTADALKNSSRSLLGGIECSRRVLVSGQVALTLVVLISAGVFTKSLDYLQRSALRFSGNQVLNAKLMPLPGGRCGW